VRQAAHKIENRILFVRERIRCAAVRSAPAAHTHRKRRALTVTGLRKVPRRRFLLALRLVQRAQLELKQGPEKTRVDGRSQRAPQSIRTIFWTDDSCGWAVRDAAWSAASCPPLHNRARGSQQRAPARATLDLSRWSCGPWQWPASTRRPPPAEASYPRTLHSPAQLDRPAALRSHACAPAHRSTCRTGCRVARRAQAPSSRARGRHAPPRPW
jgi:hypothetical protein